MSVYSTFQNCKLALQGATALFHCFTLDMTARDGKNMLPHLAHTTVFHFYGKLRKNISQRTENIVIEGSLEGIAQVIEKDESIFRKKQKFNRGSPTKW